MFVAGTIAIPTKFLVGRSRPFNDEGPYHFKPLHGGLSFPSGHSTQAFAMAAVVSEYADNPWGSVAAYGGAVLVGLARMEQRSHFVSDVVAGALIGTLSAKAVMSRHRTLRSDTKSHFAMSISPIWSGDSLGLLVSVKF
jgi:membrane-associated phospholipid phosphatase